MGSLAGCLKKAGKALDRDDVKAIREIHDDLVAAGDPNPAENAISEYLGILAMERETMVNEIRAQGGRIPKNITLAKSRNRDIAEKITLLDILTGDETLDIPDAKVTKAGKLRATAKQLAVALIKRMKKANRGRDLSAMTERSKDIIAETLALETAAAIQRTGHAGDWYSTVLQNAVNIAGEIHPELKTDITARAMFMLGLAITSNGQEVYANSVSAEEVYAEYKRTGKFPHNSYGNQGGAMVDAFETANRLIGEWGLETFTEFLMTEFTVGELKNLGFEVAGENVDFVTHGSIIFGPKVGGGFFQNLMGNFDPITMDRWFMRTWGRITGTLLPDQTALPETQKNRFVEEIYANPKKVEALGWTVEAATASDDALLEFAKAVHRSYAKSSSKYSKTYGDKSAFHKAGKNLDIAMNAPIIAPISGAQRAWIREVTALALEKLNQRGVPVNSASLQALVWYPEKELYLQHGVGNAKSAPTDYEKEFARIAAERGLDQSRIDAARTGNTDKRLAADARDDGRGAGEAAVEEQTQASLGPKEKQRLVHFEVTKRIRQQLPRASRRAVPRGAQRAVGDAGVIQVFRPNIKTRNAYNKVGLATPDILELHSLQEGAKVFFDAITAAANANKAGAAVYVYPQEEYEDMRLFITEDGLSGFALKGDDIVSVFKHPDSEHEGIAQFLIATAVDEGGRRLDAFDTVLPLIYSMQGFRVISRTAWNEDFAPENWDKKTFEKFNDGEPDVVFMVYDRNNPHAYTGQSEGVLVDDYETAVEMQEQAVEDLDERNKPPFTILKALPKDTEERINRDPTSPLARLHKLGATMEDQANQPPMNFTLAKIRDLMDRVGPRTLLALVPRRYLVDFLPKAHAPSLQKYLRLANRMSGRRNELMMEAESIARRWAKFNNKNRDASKRMSELMHAATLAGIDPAEKYKPRKKPENMDEIDKREDALRREQYVKLKSFWDALPEEAQQIYKDVRDNYKVMRKRVEEGLMARIENSEADGKTKQAMMDTLRKKFEAGRVTGPYFPLMRYGDLWASAKDADGNVVSFSRFENRKDQKEWVKEFRDAGYEVDLGRHSEQVAGEMFERIDPRFATKIANLAAQTGDDTLVDEIWQAYLRSLPEMSMRKQFMHRKGRLGFAADGLRAFATVSFRAAHQQAKLEWMHQMENTLQDLFREVREIEKNPDLAKEFNWAMPVYDEMKKRHKTAQNPSAAPWAVRTTGLGFLWYLGFTPAAAAVNLTQTALVGFPVLAAEFNVIGAGSELSKASALFAGARGNLENRLRGDERKAFDEARRIGLFEKTQAHDLAGVTERGSAGSYGGIEAKTMEIGSWFFHQAERMNREVTFLAAYRLARLRGDLHEDAVLKAEDLVWDSHFDYNNENRPVWMQSNWGRVITLFKQYSLNMTYRMLRDFRDGVLRNSNISKEERNKAAKRFVGMMGMAGLFAGYTGLPSLLTMPVEFLAEALFDDEDDPFDFEDAMRSYVAEQMGPEFAEWFMKGAVDGGLGLTISNRVSLGQLWWREPDVNADEEASLQHILMELLGPVPTTVVDIAATAGKFASGDVDHVDRGIEKMVPKFLRDIFRAYRFSTEGALTQHTPQDVLVAPDEFDSIDLVWQSIGFTPARLTMQYEQNTALRRAEKAIVDRRAKLIDRYAIAVFANDPKEAREAMDAIARYNTKQPSYAIDGDTLSRSAEQKLMRHYMSKGGVTLNRRLLHLYDKYSFTPEERLPASEGEEEEDND